MTSGIALALLLALLAGEDEVLAREHLVAGRLAEARAALERVLDGDPGDVRARYDLAEVEERLGDVGAALAHYRELTRGPGGLHAHARLANLLWRVRGDFPAAREALDRGERAAEAAPRGVRRRVLSAIEWERGALATEEEKRRGLRELDDRQDRLLMGIALAWLVVLGGGLLLLRRFRAL